MVLQGNTGAGNRSALNCLQIKTSATTKNPWRGGGILCTWLSAKFQPTNRRFKTTEMRTVTTIDNVKGKGRRFAFEATGKEKTSARRGFNLELQKTT